MASARTAQHRARLGDHSRQGPDWVGPGRYSSIADSSGPQLFRAPGMPCCTRHGHPSLCGLVETHHFDVCDHPPGPDGSHPYIVIAHAEAAGANMEVARELLGELEKAVQLLWPVMDASGDVTAEEFVARATHYVWQDPLQPGDPAGTWAAQQEARYSQPTEQMEQLPSPPEYRREHVRNTCAGQSWSTQLMEQLRSASVTNAKALQQKQLQFTKSECEVVKSAPQFLRVTERMRRHREAREAVARDRRRDQSLMNMWRACAWGHAPVYQSKK